MLVYPHLISVLFFLLLTTGSLVAESVKKKPLPEPLTLSAALQLIDNQHPDVRYASANVMSAMSELQRARLDDDMKVSFSAVANWFEPSPLAYNQFRDEQYLALSVNKNIYDFGRTSTNIDIAGQQLQSDKFLLLSARQNHYLDVMQKYFAVVLADLQFYRYNEEMSVAYIEYDRIQNRHKLGQSTEVEVAEKEAAYQRIRRLRMQSQGQQRISRARLAQALNRPGDLPSTVSRPQFDELSRKLPEVEELQKLALENNPDLKAIRARLKQAELKVESAKLLSKPDISGSASVYEYSKITPSSTRWRANISLNVPLLDGDRVDAGVARARSELYRLQAELQQKEMDIQQQVLELILGLEVAKIKYEEAEAVMNYTELSLDKNRALYELEVKSDLGDSMVRYSEAERNLVKIGFDISMAWATLDALTGRLLDKNKTTKNK